ncbi:hypothetical protein CYMTET_32165, partial [Cymbomonas tetramitiformis]
AMASPRAMALLGITPRTIARMLHLGKLGGAKGNTHAEWADNGGQPRRSHFLSSASQKAPLTQNGILQHAESWKLAGYYHPHTFVGGLGDAVRESSRMDCPDPWRYSRSDVLSGLVRGIGGAQETDDTLANEMERDWKVAGVYHSKLGGAGGLGASVEERHVAETSVWGGGATRTQHYCEPSSLGSDEDLVGVRHRDQSHERWNQPGIHHHSPTASNLGPSYPERSLHPPLHSLGASTAGHSEQPLRGRAHDACSPKGDVSADEQPSKAANIVHSRKVQISSSEPTLPQQSSPTDGLGAASTALPDALQRKRKDQSEPLLPMRSASGNSASKRWARRHICSPSAPSSTATALGDDVACTRPQYQGKGV